MGGVVAVSAQKDITLDVNGDTIELATFAGTVDVAIPKLRHGSFFPDWLLERRTRTERALTTVIATCYLKACLPAE